ncbi:MAG TPA: 4-alpha-glucanotransferase [Acidobacteriota bacterium]|nr:4-alpha-glucanotransferase [Acidobacteriota bacterium]
MIARSSGLLCHITSLPSAHGIGDLGPEARRFADFMAAAGQKVWQVLPLRPTGYGDSPYQCVSSFAGNAMLISLEKLVEDGFLASEEIGEVPRFPASKVDFGQVLPFKEAALEKAFHRFLERGDDEETRRFESFCQFNAHWLDDYALYRAIKEERDKKAWMDWEAELVRREPEALRQARASYAHRVSFHKLCQYFFRRQWDDLKAYCLGCEVQIMGDIPIFVAHDSSDVWAHQELFQLDAKGHATEVAGVPPDYFSATGQLWGNPLYRWEVMEERGYKWWIDRLRSEFSLVDIVRLDHFRGFEAFWAVPSQEETAINGEWRPGPRETFFEKVQEKLGDPRIVAENLGVITDEVEALRGRFGFPGMAILQFAFGTDMKASDFQPHRYPRNLVVYTGTHDNDTVQGWWSGGVGASTRDEDQARKEKDFARRYLNIRDDVDVHWDYIRAILSSVADLAMIPVQDLLGLGSEARMNTPGKGQDNWTWRLRSGALDESISEKLAELCRLYER